MHVRYIQQYNQVLVHIIREMCIPRSLGCEDLDLDLAALLILTATAASFMAKAGAPAEEE